MRFARSGASLSLQTHLLLLVAATLPLGALIAGPVLHARSREPGWLIVVAALLVLAFGLALTLARRIANVAASVTGAARAIAHGDTPVLGTFPIRELDELARAVAAAGSARRDSESRLLATEARLAAILDATPAAVMCIDAARRVLHFNRAAEALFSCPTAEAVGGAADRFFGQRFLRHIDAHLEGARGRLRALTAGHGESPVGFRRDGAELALDVALSRVETAGGPVCVLALRDVTELKQREGERAELLRREQAARGEAEQAAQRAQEAHARLAALVDGLDAIVWEADPLTLEPTFVSQRAERLLGYPLREWLDSGSWTRLIHPDDRDAALATLREHAGAGRACRIEYRMVAADGRCVWVSNLVQSVRRDDGVVGRLRGLVIDVTDRQHRVEEHDRLLAAEQAARADAEVSAHRARFLAEASELLSSSLDRGATLDSLARLAVPAFADWCLVHLAEPVGGRRLHAAAADPDGARLAAALERLAPALELPALLPLLERLKAGEALLLPEIGPAWLESLQLLQQLAPRSVMVVPLVARGRTLGTLTFIATRSERRYDQADLLLARDLAHRAAIAVDNARLYAEAESANRAKDQFLATLSHELRTPLTAMLGWVLMLRSGRLTGDEAAGALASIERNTRVQAQLINDLLDVSRIVAGKLTIERRPVDLRVVIEHALDSVRRETEGRRHVVTCTIDPDAAWVPGDAVRLEQVVVNLVGNAAKFTPEGGHIDVRLDRHEGLARVRVSDTGQGIEPAMLPHIFESFRQGDSSSTRRHGGLGLGLAIVRRLVALHGGRVEATSAGRGHGAAFAVHLPLLADEARPALALALPAGEAPRPREDPGSPRLDGVRALVVDDHEDSRRFVKTVLADSGADVQEADSVDAALDILATTYVDVLVSDIGMPGADGYDLITRVREREREHGGRIPAVALTAYAGEENRDRALAAGFSAHVTKPVSPAALVRIVAQAIERPALA
ncbi:MAG TPA: ATP-binding protein [Methylomirabilota bacterium]|nr:ATP-binding protein [Methylomirabilota bacterium]